MSICVTHQRALSYVSARPALTTAMITCLQQRKRWENYSTGENSSYYYFVTIVINLVSCHLIFLLVSQSNEIYHDKNWARYGNYCNDDGADEIYSNSFFDQRCTLSQKCFVFVLKDYHQQKSTSLHVYIQYDFHNRQFVMWNFLLFHWIVQLINILRPKQDGRHFAADIFICIFLNENVWISLKISLKFVPIVRINNVLVLVQIVAWHRPGDKPLSEPMMVSLLMLICVTWPQWVNHAEFCFPWGIYVLKYSLLIDHDSSCTPHDTFYVTNKWCKGLS